MHLVHVSNHPLIQAMLTELRDKATPPDKFRRLVRELGRMLAYEATTDLKLVPCQVETPVGTAQGQALQDSLAIAFILRAALGMAEGVLKMVPDAKVCHLGVFRDEKTLQPVWYYNKLAGIPPVKVCIVTDPMLATGGTAVDAIKALKVWGAEQVRFIGIIAAPEGIKALNTAHPDVAIYVAAIDEGLNDRGYIVPGLGDAGDRQFGTL